MRAKQGEIYVLFFSCRFLCVCLCVCACVRASYCKKKLNNDIRYHAFIGEEDLYLRRGKPLYLSRVRYRQLRRIWSSGASLHDAYSPWTMGSHLH